MIKGVVFDLDHTLYDRDGCSRAAMDTFSRCFPERFMPGVSREAARELMIQAEHRAIYGGWSAIVAELRRLEDSHDRAEAEYRRRRSELQEKLDGLRDRD